MMGNSLQRWAEGLNGPRFRAQEVRVICAIFLCVVPIALGLVLAFEHDLALTAGFQELGGDCPQFFMSGWLLNLDPPSALYALELQKRLPLEVRTVDRGVMFPFVYPPFFAMIFRPFALLTYPWAYATWSAISLGLCVAGLLVMFRQSGLISQADKKTAFLLALAFEPFLVDTLAGGQVSSRSDVVEQDARTDGRFPLLTNTELTPAEVLDAHKAQPRLESRLAQFKSVEAATPVWLKKTTSIESLRLLYFLSVLVQAILEHELRRAMAAAGIDHLPRYPEEPGCRAPSAERVLEAFISLQWHDLWAGDRRVQTFRPQFDALQERIVTLRGMPSAELTT